MDPLSIQEGKLTNTLHQILPQYNPVLHLKSYQYHTLHLNPWQQTGWRLFSKCRKLTLFCKWISKHLPNGKAPQHETDLFTHVRGLLYKHITDSGQTFLALLIPKSWKYTVLMEAHDKLGHQGNTCTYCFIKHQYYWKGMNKDIRKYIANYTLCHSESKNSKLLTSDDGDSWQTIQ